MARLSATSEAEVVFREDGDRLWRALYAFAGDPDVASDAVAEAFAQALRRGSAIGHVRAWVWRSAFRIAAGELKRHSVLVRDSMPEGVFHDDRDGHQLLGVLQQLTPQQRIVLTLFYYVDCPVREIALRTGMNQIAVRAHLSRGRKQMRTLMGDDHA